MNTLSRILLLLLLLGSVAGGWGKRTLDDPLAGGSIYRGYTWRIDEQGDSMLVLYLKDLPVYPARKFKNKKEEEFYWRTVRNVKLTLPYAKLIAETLLETYEYIETFPTKKSERTI